MVAQIDEAAGNAIAHPAPILQMRSKAMKQEYLAMPVEASDPIFYRHPGASILLMRLYRARNYHTDKVVIDLRAEAVEVGLHRNALNKYWAELQVLNNQLGQPFFAADEDGKAIVERRGRLGMMLQLKHPGGQSGAGGEAGGGEMAHIYVPNAREMAHADVPNSEPAVEIAHADVPNNGAATDLAQAYVPNDEEMAHRRVPNDEEMTLASVPNGEMAHEMAHGSAHQRVPNQARDQYISRSIDHLPTSRQAGGQPLLQSDQVIGRTPNASPPASPLVGMENVADELCQLYSYQQLPPDWLATLTVWQAEAHPPDHYERLLRWARDYRDTHKDAFGNPTPPTQGKMKSALATIAKGENGNGRMASGANGRGAAGSGAGAGATPPPPYRSKYGGGITRIIPKSKRVGTYSGAGAGEAGGDGREPPGLESQP